MKSLHIRIPDDLAESMREEAYGSRRSLNSIAVDALYEFRKGAFASTERIPYKTDDGVVVAVDLDGTVHRS